MNKDPWTKPELIILMRNHPEETLQQDKCKSPTTTIGYSNEWNKSCAEKAGPENRQCFNSAGGS